MPTDKQVVLFTLDLQNFWTMKTRRTQPDRVFWLQECFEQPISKTPLVFLSIGLVEFADHNRKPILQATIVRSTPTDQQAAVTPISMALCPVKRGHRPAELKNYVLARDQHRQSHKIEIGPNLYRIFYKFGPRDDRDEDDDQEMTIRRPREEDFDPDEFWTCAATPLLKPGQTKPRGIRLGFHHPEKPNVILTHPLVNELGKQRRKGRLPTIRHRLRIMCGWDDDGFWAELNY